MINKEFILNADGTIKKDFTDRNIPQYANNQVSVNVLIPSACFTGLQNYAVILGVSRIISGVETTLNSLVMTASKSITLDNVLYVKYSAILSYSYTELLGTLKVSPYIQTTATTTIEDESVEVISIQQSFTNSNLNIIKSVLPQYDASMQEADVVSTIEAQINAKKIYTFIDSDASSIGEHYYNLASSYDPNATQFEGCLVISIYDDETRQYMPYLNDGDVELLEITKDGKFYRISGVDYSNSTYTYTRLQLSYSKSEIDSQVSDLQNQINGKVDKTTKVNGYALSGDVNLTKGDVGLGNVANFGVEQVSPDNSGSQLYITSKAVYDALQVIYGIIATMPSAEDLQTITNHLNAIDTLLGSDDGDNDNIINTLKEVIDTLSGLGEDANILSMINSKVSQTDFNTLDNQINGTGGIKDKVDILTSQDNAYMEIKAQSGTIDIAVSDWVANSDAYSSDYPYKWTLTNGYLEGATNVIVVFSIDSDTSMLSATTKIDEENGVLTIYASETPLDTIKIEKIAVFNSLDAYINYSNTIVQQVNTNTTAISEINNTKLPNKVDAEVVNPNDDGDYSQIIHNYTGLTINVVENDNPVGFFHITSYGAYMSYTESNEEQGISVDNNGFKALTQDGNDIHELLFDKNGQLTIDGESVVKEKTIFESGNDTNTNEINTSPFIRLKAEQKTQSGGSTTINGGSILDMQQYYAELKNYYSANSNGKYTKIRLEPNTFTIQVVKQTDASVVHTLTFDTNGDLKIDGNAVGGGGGSQLYRHSILYQHIYGNNAQVLVCFDIINNSSNALNTTEKIIEELNRQGLNEDTKCINASGFYWDSTNSKMWTAYKVEAYYVGATKKLEIRCYSPTATSMTGATTYLQMNTTDGTVYETIVAL